MFDHIKFDELYLVPSKNGLSRESKKMGNGTKMVNMGELFGFPRMKNPEMRRVETNEKENITFGLVKGDLLFARRSLVAEGAGKCNIVLEVQNPTVFESSIIRVRLNTEIANPLFYYYYFSSDAGFSTIQSIVNEVAASGIRSSELAKLKVIHPHVNIQEQISNFIGAYDELIEINNERIILLEATARELYKEWFVRMRFPNYKNAKFVKGIPKDWMLKELKEIGNIYTGKTPPTKKREYYGGDIPFIKTPDLHKNQFIFETQEYLTEKGNNSQKRSTLPKGAICVSCIGTGGIVGITTAEKSQTNQQINSIIPFNKVELEFLFYAVSDLKETIELFGYTGATMTNLSKGKFEKLRILYPTSDLMELYHKTTMPMFEMIQIIQQQNTQLRETRDRLLPRLISGKLKLKLNGDYSTTKSIESHQVVDTIEKSTEDTKVKSNPFFQRRILAAHIIDRLKDEPTFGHVKLMKLMYLCEHLAEIETASHYHRDAAGPYDNRMIRSIDSQLKKAQWFECKKTGNKYQYTALPKKEEYKNWFTKYYSDKEAGIENLLHLFGKEKTEKAEMVATLYEAWRDLKDKKQLPTEQAIIYEVLNNWHESKQRISEERWLKCLQWMKEKNWIT